MLHKIEIEKNILNLIKVIDQKKKDNNTIIVEEEKLSPCD